MTLNDLKRVAKRILKNPGLIEGLSELTHAQALDIASRLHGFRDYHAARAQLGRSDLLSEVTAEPGGALLTGGIAYEIAPFLAAREGVQAIVGQTGAGKSMLAREFILHSLKLGKVVRILSNCSSYKTFTLSLGGKHFVGEPDDETKAAWEGDERLVTVDQLPFSSGSDMLRRLGNAPKDAVLVCDDCALGAPLSSAVGFSRVICVGHHPAEIERSGFRPDVTVQQDREMGLKRQWKVSTPQGEQPFQFVAGPLRMLLLASDSPLQPAMVQDAESMEALKAFSAAHLGRVVGLPAAK